MTKGYKYIKVRTKDNKIQTFENVLNLNLPFYDRMEFDTPISIYRDGRKIRIPGKTHHAVSGQIIISAAYNNPEEFHKKENNYNFTQIHIDIGEEKPESFSHIYNFKRTLVPDSLWMEFDTISHHSNLHIEIKGHVIHTAKIIPAKLFRKPYPHFWTTIMKHK